MGTSPTLASRLARRPEVLSKVLDGEAVLVDLDGGTYYGLDAVGTLIWESLDGQTSLATVVERIVASYDVTPEDASQDCLRLASDLLARNLAREVT